MRALTLGLAEARGDCDDGPALVAAVREGRYDDAVHAYNDAVERHGGWAHVVYAPYEQTMTPAEHDRALSTI